MIIGLTGHRPHKLNNEWHMDGPCSAWLRGIFTQVIRDRRPTMGISGMALGSDMLWTMTLLENEIPVLAAIPSPGQDSKWNDYCRNLYRVLISSPKVKVHAHSQTYQRGCEHERDRLIADWSDELISVWDGSESGTGTTTAYFQRYGRPIHRIDPSHFLQNQ